MQFSRRMDNLAPYLFAEMERRITEKRKSGVDVISLGIGDPDLPTPPYIVEEMQRQVAAPPITAIRATGVCRNSPRPPQISTRRRFGVRIDPQAGVLPATGSQGRSGPHLLLCSIRVTLALVPDPGYPVYAGGSLIAGAEVRYLHLAAESGFLPDLEGVAEEDARRAKVLFLGYPNNPTTAVVEDGFFEKVVAFAKKIRRRRGARQRVFRVDLSTGTLLPAS